MHLLTGWKNANEDYVVNVVIEHVTDEDREDATVMAAFNPNPDPNPDPDPGPDPDPDH